MRKRAVMRSCTRSGWKSEYTTREYTKKSFGFARCQRFCVVVGRMHIPQPDKARRVAQNESKQKPQAFSCTCASDHLCAHTGMHVPVLPVTFCSLALSLSLCLSLSLSLSLSRFLSLLSGAPEVSHAARSFVGTLCGAIMFTSDIGHVTSSVIHCTSDIYSFTRTSDIWASAKTLRMEVYG